jgi:hypothetical protein
VAKLDYAKAKADIAEIIEIVKTVPEALQQRCFELLFEAAFSNVKSVPEPKQEPTLEKTEAVPPEEKKASPSDKATTPGLQNADGCHR